MSEEQARAAGTRIDRLHTRILELHRPVYGLSDDERAARCDAQFGAVTALVGMPAENFGDVEIKLAVLCRRLRDDGQGITSPNGALTLMLADSARDDIGRLAGLGAPEGLVVPDADLPDFTVIVTGLDLQAMTCVVDSVYIPEAESAVAAGILAAGAYQVHAGFPVRAVYALKGRLLPERLAAPVTEAFI